MPNFKVLIADDVDVMRKLLRSKLSKLGCEVLAEVESGNDVIKKVKEHSPEMVFLDINMPGRSGLDLLQEIKTKHPTIFVAMVSAYNTFENIKKSMELGADGFVVKPFSVQKLQEMVEKYRDKLKQAS